MINETPIFCIFPRLGKGGGGKVRAIFNRLNVIADLAGLRPILLNLSHSVSQKVVFAELQEAGVLSQRVEHLSLFEASAGRAIGDDTLPPLPTHDAIKENGSRKTYFNHGDKVAELTETDTLAGTIAVRQDFQNGRVVKVYRFLNDILFESQSSDQSGRKVATSYVHGKEIATEISDGTGKFLTGINHIALHKYKLRSNFHKSFIRRAIPTDSLTFIDGGNQAYLSIAIKSPKILFLHADHRIDGGETSPRSRNIIKGFDGSAIVTATHAHKTRLRQDLAPALPIEIIPHFVDLPRRQAGSRQHLCTVSRLDLDGKPIDHAVEAFARIKDHIPDVDYHIYGSGSGHEMLETQIRDLGCEDRIKLMGYTSDPVSVFSSSLASIYPTKTEGFGLAILESLACGCPVVTYDVDYGPRELIRSGENGRRVTPGDIDEFASAILDCVEHGGHYSTRCREGLERYRYASHRENYERLFRRYGPGFL